MKNPENSSCSMIFLLFVALLLVQGQGCATPNRQVAVPVTLQDKAQVPGFSGIRYWVGKDQAEMAREGLESVRREQAHLAASGNKGQFPSAIFLAISGGGDNGAFGAGLLNGWTAAGNRPQFKVVTGISTGAITAPFTFLGSEYDNKLKEFYTTTYTNDIVKKRSFMAFLTSDALNDTQPLWDKLEKHITMDLLDEIAAEYKKGRQLLAATVNLDARYPIIWNLTKIAASNDSNALQLFRTVMIASASIPVAFPPVMVDVEVGGQQYQEMHVGGGTMGQVFIYPPPMDLQTVAREASIERERKLYIIRNSRLDPEWASVERRVMPITERAINSMIQTQGIGDLYRILTISQRDGLEYNLACIPATFNAPKKEAFDPEYMGRLFDMGFEMAVNGYPWQKLPPGYDPLDDVTSHKTSASQ